MLIPRRPVRFTLALTLVLSIAVETAIGRRLFQGQDQAIQAPYYEKEPLFPKTCEEVYVHNPKARDSQSCSLGKTKFFMKAIDTWQDIRDMLEARSYNGEIIVTHETRHDVVSQWLWRMLRMGYSHTVVVMRGELSCEPLRKLFGEHLGCVWFRTTVWYPATSTAASLMGAGAAALVAGGANISGTVLQPGQVGLFLEETMYWRLELATFILRIGGHNVLMVDTDTMLLDDFYWWMAQPEYKDYQLLSQLDGMGTLNIGVMYFRGVAPGGPTTWAMAEALLRNVRWKERPQLLLQINITNHICWDQSAVTDTVFSAIAGRPLFWRCLAHRMLDRGWNQREDGRKAFEAASEALFKPAFEAKLYPVSRSGPACHIPTEGPAGIKALQSRLVMPHSGGQWPEELGGRPLGGRPLGPVAAAFVSMMREAGTPMWPDPEDPAAAADAAAVPPERFAFFSRHVVCDFSGCGQNGLFQPAMRPSPQEPCVVIAHVGVSPDATSGKRFQLMVNGHYSMALAEAMHGPGGPYFATNAHHSAGNTHHGAMRAGRHHHRAGQQRQYIPLPHVIALAPAALAAGPSPNPSAPAAPLVLRSKEHMVQLVRALGTVAVASGRTLGLPRLSCDFPWMHRGEAFPFNGSHYVPWRYIRGEAFAPFGPSIDNITCEWFAWVQAGCLHGPFHAEKHGHGHVNPHAAARMLLSYEMKHFLAQLPAADREPTAHTAAAGRAAATSASGSGNLVSVPPGANPGPDGVVNVTMAQLAQQLRGIDPDKPVVWLERPMRVTDLPDRLNSAFQMWSNHCCGLSWPDSFQRICFWEF